MIQQRREFMRNAASFGLAGTIASLFGHSLTAKAFGQLVPSSYKAIVVIELGGGNDANNMIVPMDPALYAQYASLRGGLALPLASLLPLRAGIGQPTYGLHPSLVNVARLYNQQRAAVVCNVGPITAPTTKQALLAGKTAYPDSLKSHPNGIAQWETASAYNTTMTGWGGRLGDLIVNQSGKLPPVLNASVQSVFTVGETVQAVAVQGGGAFPALPNPLQIAINSIGADDEVSGNALIVEAAKIRQASLAQQAILSAAVAYQPLKTDFGVGFSQVMKTLAQLVAGRSVVGASRQIFYTAQGSYDSHSGQLPQHAGNLQDLDQGLGSFFQALDELGLSDQVLVCTHSDFNRTLTSNTNAGSDHAWGSHQLLLGGGIKGGQLFGKMPTLDLNGPDDQDGEGTWIPTTSVSQLTAGIGSFMGLNTSQLNKAFPELRNFPIGPLQLL